LSLVAIVGPTASGKTAAAIRMAQEWGADIIGADASQVYRGMDIGTGKARPAELDGVVHHMIDVVDPAEHFDAAEYARMAQDIIRRCEAAGRKVILCGGTGLYLKALINGLCLAPPVAAEIRERIADRVKTQGLMPLHAELAQVDPKSAQRIARQDAQRIERALGVYLTSGRSLSDWQAESDARSPKLAVEWIGIRWPRAVLQARIAERIDEMLATGWVEEVRALRADGHHSGQKSMGALGYRYLSEHLAGELDLALATQKILVATRRYAKRQMTWFKANPEITWYDAPLGENIIHDAFTEIWG
jgi:tRNA dimethylallyltransferase